MKLLPIPQKKLQATAARRLGPSRAMEEEDKEPTTKLSKAFVIVLLLHVVFILGVYSFCSINAHRPPATVADPQSAPPIGKTTGVEPAAAVATGDPAKAPDATAKKLTATVASSGPKDSGAVYTVIKGEAPERIAKKLGVSFNDLMKLNHLDDPKKLQIGQKLRVPVKKTPSA